MYNINLLERILTLRLRAPLNLSSGWGYLGKIDYSHRQQRALCPISFTGHRGVKQKKLTSDPDSSKLQILLH